MKTLISSKFQRECRCINRFIPLSKTLYTIYLENYMEIDQYMLPSARRGFTGSRLADSAPTPNTSNLLLQLPKGNWYCESQDRKKEGCL